LSHAKFASHIGTQRLQDVKNLQYFSMTYAQARDHAREII
jgi:hypothetical protein